MVNLCFSVYHLLFPSKLEQQKKIRSGGSVLRWLIFCLLFGKMMARGFASILASHLSSCCCLNIIGFLVYTYVL